MGPGRVTKLDAIVGACKWAPIAAVAAIAEREGGVGEEDPYHQQHWDKLVDSYNLARGPPTIYRHHQVPLSLEWYFQGGGVRIGRA